MIADTVVTVRASRLIALVMLCRTRDRWTAAELADELGVSVRTIYRDVSELQSAGVPLWAQGGPGGGIHLLPGWRNQLDGLTGEEAAVLAMSGPPTALSELGLGAVALSARLKLRSALPPELRTRAARIEERFHLDAPGWFHRPDDVEHLGTVADAVWAGRRIDISYERGPRRVRRRLDPLGLVLKAGVWYLVARHRGAVRTYRIGRIRHCELRTDTFERPDGFDLSTWWAASAEAFDRSLLRFHCELAIAPWARRRLELVTDPGAAQRALADASPLPDPTPDRDGWVVVQLECESEAVAADQLLGLASGVEVRSPAGLRRRLHDLGTAIAAANQPPADASSS